MCRLTTVVVIALVAPLLHQGRSQSSPTVKPPPATTAAPAPNSTESVGTIPSESPNYYLLIGGGTLLFALLIFGCYVTLMWQQRSLRLYRSTFEEIIKERLETRREIQRTVQRGEYVVNNYDEYAQKDDEDERDDDTSPAAMRARILGQHYQAQKYVEHVEERALIKSAPHPKTYVGKGPIFRSSDPYCMAEAAMPSSRAVDAQRTTWSAGEGSIDSVVEGVSVAQSNLDAIRIRTQLRHLSTIL
jgi:hypothetical protein